MITPTIELERKLWNEGYLVVVGLDEAGRGPLAGPLTAGAVVISNEKQIVPGVRDSKKMSEKQREDAFEKIIKLSTAYGIGIVSNEEIDKLGIQLAVKTAMIQALEQVLKTTQKIDYIIADGKNISLIEGYNMVRITKGDMYHYSISAGSILAKVTRDRIMKDLAKQYPEYGFESHVGYGTKTHIEMIKKYGPCKIHRKSFKPISQYFQ